MTETRTGGLIAVVAVFCCAVIGVHVAAARMGGTALPFAASHASTDDLPTYELTNGHWFIGTEFEARTMYMEGGVLRTERPAEVDFVIDLGGGYVVPAFGEAHSHRPANPDRTTNGATAFLEAGVFYVMNHGSLARYRDGFDAQVNQPGSIDMAMANALIASPQSHGVDLWRRLVGRGAFPGVEVDALDGDAYFMIESPDDLRRAWPDVLETRPDFIKVMVEYSEEYESRRDDPAYFGRSGLDPDLIPEIVSLAHAAGLRVSAHIETAADFHVVVAAGVDIVAHLPGYDIPEDDSLSRYRIDPSDATRAAEQGVIVVTTTLLSLDRAAEDPMRLERMQDNQKHNLRLLAEAGVELAVGSDQYSKNSVDEMLNLASLDVFDTATLLDMLCRVTPQAIFPLRRIGVLEDGAEASFLVLNGNPLESLQYVRDISIRVKEGEPLESR